MAGIDNHGGTPVEGFTLTMESGAGLFHEPGAHRVPPGLSRGARGRYGRAQDKAAHGTAPAKERMTG